MTLWLYLPEKTPVPTVGLVDGSRVEVIKARLEGLKGKTLRAYVHDWAGRKWYEKTFVIYADVEEKTLIYSDELKAILDVTGVRGTYDLLAIVEEDGKVIEAASIPFIITDRFITPEQIPGSSTVKNPYTVIIYDRIASREYKYQPDVDAVVRFPTGNEFLSMRYSYDVETKTGDADVIYGTEPGVDHITNARRVLMKFSRDFVDTSDALRYMWNLLLIVSSYKHEIYEIFKRPDITDEDKLRLLAPYASYALQRHCGGRLLNVEFIATSPPKLVVEAEMEFGFLSIDWGKVVAISTGSFVGIVTAFVLNAIIPVLGIAAGVVVASIVTLYVYETLASSPAPPAPDNFKNNVDDSAQRGHTSADKAIDESQSLYERLLAEGKITKEAYDLLIADSERLRKEWHATIDEVKETAYEQIDKAWSEGYKRGHSDAMKKMLPISAACVGVGGVLGYIVGRK